MDVSRIITSVNEVEPTILTRDISVISENEGDVSKIVTNLRMSVIAQIDGFILLFASAVIFLFVI